MWQNCGPGPAESQIATIGRFASNGSTCSSSVFGFGRIRSVRTTPCRHDRTSVASPVAAISHIYIYKADRVITTTCAIILKIQSLMRGQRHRATNYFRIETNYSPAHQSHILAPITTVAYWNLHCNRDIKRGHLYPHTQIAPMIWFPYYRSWTLQHNPMKQF